MKKNLLLLSGMLLLAQGSFAYKYMNFYNISGETKAIETKGLTIKLQGSNLIATNDKNQTLKLPVASLTAMEFSEDGKSGVSVTSTEAKGPVTLYNIDGVVAGTFRSLQDARKELVPGIYVMKNNEETTKIFIGK